jgi:acetamidase/formamidase
MTSHRLEPARQTLHGHFSRALAPVLTIDSGDTVRVRTLDAGWHLAPPPLDGSPRRHFEPRDAVLDAGHPICGPIAVRGAEPGMTLEIELLEIVPGAWGWTRGGGWSSPVNTHFGLDDGQDELLVWSLDATRGVARDQHGHEVTMRPFLGLIGVAPPEPGVHSTIPPRRWGGNMDCRELVAGSRLRLPVGVPGALLSLGDGHAAQGDGEVSGVGIECPMERVELRITLDAAPAPRAPIAETPAGTVTLGFGDTLDAAALEALEGMLGVLEARHGVGRRQAIALASTVVSLRVSQIVNQVVGVHAVLPPGAIRG